MSDYTAVTLKIRMGREGGGKGAIWQYDKSATLSTGNDQTLFEPIAVYGICSKNSNSMKSANPCSGIYEADTARTLDTSVPDPNKNAGGMAVVAVEGHGSRPSHRGDGFSDKNVSYTLNCTEKHSVCHPVCYQEGVGALCASDYKFAQNQQIETGKAIVERVAIENFQHGGYRESGTAGTLKQSGGTNEGGSESVIVENRYVVRRLTPTECALLQGFPPDWCADLGTPEPTEEEIVFWTEVFDTKARIDCKKPKSRKQIIKWLQNPHTDAAEYKLWGNGLCYQGLRATPASQAQRARSGGTRST